MIENGTIMIILETDHTGLKTSLADTMKQEVYTAQDIHPHHLLRVVNKT